MSLHEVQRITEVYRRYDVSQEVQARRDMANRGNQYLEEERRRTVRRVLEEQGLQPLMEKRILDVGCGRGDVLASLLDLGAQPQHLYGIDLLPDRIEAARQANPSCHFVCGNAEHLDFPDASFDLALLFTVFSSILDDGMARNVAKEVRRVLKPGGAALWYDFRYNNPWNLHTRGMTRGHVRRLFPGWRLRLRTISLAPPLARRLDGLTPVLYPLLASIPPLRTHYLGLLLPPAEARDASPGQEKE